MNNDDRVIYCSRCGAEMKASSRYCMKCGNLNYDHPENNNMKKFIDEKNVQSYEVGSGKFIMGNVSNNSGVIKSIANNTGNKGLCFYLTFSLYLVLLLISIFPLFFKGNFSLDTVVASTFPIKCIIFSVAFLYIYSIELLFMKANKRWWAGLIPIYNVMILSEMAFNKKNLGLIVLVPVVGVIYLFVLFYKIGEKFEYSGIITVLFNVVMIPVIAFGDHLYDKRTFTDDSVNSTEVDYKRKKTFLLMALVFCIIGIALLVYANMTQVKSTSEGASNYYYVYATNKMVKKLSEAIESGEITCEDDVTYDASTGTYYFYIGDAGDEFNLFLQIMRDPIEAYIKIENVNGEAKYYISMTDGKKGFAETLAEEVTTDTIVDYPSLTTDYKNGNSCFMNG